MRRTWAATSFCAIAATVLFAIPALAGTPNTWTTAHALSTGRYEHMAVPLTSGKVLVMGGQPSSSTATATAEIYDPATDIWSAAAPMSTARTGAGAVTLPNGNVLVAGGSTTGSNSGAVATAEVYNPAANTWTATTNPMGSARYVPTATLMPNGQVLVAGGEDVAGSPLATADLYNPSTNSFTAAHAMGTGRYFASASLAGNGEVLVAGGFGTASTIIAGAEVYNPTSNTWTAVGNSMSSPRAAAPAVTLPDGRVLIAGGESQSTPQQVVASTDIYSPATNSFTAGASMASARVLYGLTSLADGRVLAAGGVTFSGSSGAIVPTAELYAPTSNTWTSAAPLSTGVAALTTTLLPNGQVLAAGGSADLQNGSTNAQLYTPTSTPGAPQAVTATAGSGSAQVVFAPPASDGGLAVQHYTVRASTGQTAVTPDGRTYALVPGLANGRAVTFTVTATNALGTSPASAPSAAVTPTAPAGPDTAPTVKVTGLRGKLKLKAFLAGIKFKVTPSKAASLTVSLVASATRATIAKAFNLTLATTSTTLSSSARTVKLVPSKKLVGHAKRVKIRVVIVATDAAKTSSTTTKTISVGG